MTSASNAEFATKHVMRPSYDFGAEFEFGLALLDEIERALARPEFRECIPAGWAPTGAGLSGSVAGH